MTENVAWAGNPCVIVYMQNKGYRSPSWRSGRASRQVDQGRGGDPTVYLPCKANGKKTTEPGDPSMSG